MNLYSAFGESMEDEYLNVKVKVITKAEHDSCVGTFLDFVTKVSAVFEKTKDWVKAVTAGINAIKDCNNRVSEIVQKEGIEMVSLFEQEFDKDSELGKIARCAEVRHQEEMQEFKELMTAEQKQEVNNVKLNSLRNSCKTFKKYNLPFEELVEQYADQFTEDEIKKEYEEV